METTSKPRLHPLLTAAAISVTVFSAAGVAALTGLLPHSSGTIGGGIAGAVLGNQFGHGTGRSIMTVLGAAGGALAGKEIEKQHNATKRWDITVRLDDGSHQTLSSQSLPYWHAGDRVRFLDGKLQPV